jgi:hypothetical protein
MCFTREQLLTGAVTTRAMYTRYYAIGIPKLTTLIEAVGFEKTARLDEVFYQPMLVASKPR